jgi:hypothetical protein
VGNSAPSAASNSTTTTGNYFIALSGYNFSQSAASSARLVGSSFITTVNGNASYGGVPGLGVNTSTGNNSYAVMGGTGNTIYPWVFGYYSPTGPGSMATPNNGLIDSSGNTYAFGKKYGSGTGFSIASKTNSSGAKQWGLTWGSIQEGLFNSVQWDQGGYIMAVGAAEYSGSKRGFFTRITEGGSVLISKLSNLQINMTGGDVDSSGNYIVTAFFREPTGGPQIPFVGKYDSGGTLVWGKNYTINGVNVYFNEGAYRCMVVIGTDIYVGGSIFDNSTQVGVIAKISGTDGSVVWQKNYSPACGFYSVTVESDGYLYWGGQTESGGVGIIVKTDTSGTQSWSRYVGGVTSRNARAILSGSDLYIAGAYNIPNYAPYYLKVPADGSRMGTYTVGAYSVTYGANAVSGSTASSLASTDNAFTFTDSYAASADTYSTSGTISDTTTVTII